MSPPRPSPAPYDDGVANLVLTVIGDDRAGLVSALAEAVTTHGGNWERSQLAELAGKFAGIVVVSVPDESRDRLVEALAPVPGLEVSVYGGSDTTASAPSPPNVTLDLVGNDRPGIVLEVTTVLSRHGISIDTLTTGTREAPMAGGRLFEAHLAARAPVTADLAAVRRDLELLAAELMVELTLDA